MAASSRRQPVCNLVFARRRLLNIQVERAVGVISQGIAVANGEAVDDIPEM